MFQLQQNTLQYWKRLLLPRTIILMVRSVRRAFCALRMQLATFLRRHIWVLLKILGGSCFLTQRVLKLKKNS